MVLLAVGALVVAGATGGFLANQTPTPVAASIADLSSNKNFATSTRAGTTLARISERLLNDGRRCSRAHANGTPELPRCERRLAAAGWSSVAALTTLSCTQPGTQQIRRDLLHHLQSVQDADRHSPALRPDLPVLPEC